MGRLTAQHRRQDAVYYALSGKDKWGNPTVSAGIALRVRWVTEQRETLTPDNTTQITDVRINVDRDIAVGSIFWEGKLADLPSPVTNLYQVVQKRSIPNLKNYQTEYDLFLIRYGDTLPTIA